jgi:hypothetical protein
LLAANGTGGLLTCVIPGISWQRAKPEASSLVAKGVYQMSKKKKLLKIVEKAEKKAAKKAAKKGKRSSTKVDRSDVSLI